MTLNSSENGSWTIISPTERRIDALVAEGFKIALLDAVSATKGDVAVDLSQVEFMDSSGLGALICCRQRLGPDRDMALLSPSNEVRLMLRLTHLDRVFHVAGSFEEICETTRG